MVSNSSFVYHRKVSQISRIVPGTATGIMVKLRRFETHLKRVTVGVLEPTHTSNEGFELTNFGDGWKQLCSWAFLSSGLVLCRCQGKLFWHPIDPCFTNLLASDAQLPIKCNGGTATSAPRLRLIELLVLPSTLLSPLVVLGRTRTIPPRSTSRHGYSNKG